MIEVINLRYENLTDFEKKYGAPFVEAPETSRGNVKKATITSRTRVIDATADNTDISDEVELNDEPDLNDMMGDDDLGGDGLENEEDLPDDETIPDVDDTEDTGTTDGEETPEDVPTPDAGTEGGTTGETGTDETNPAPEDESEVIADDTDASGNEDAGAPEYNTDDGAEGGDDEVVADDSDEVNIDDADGEDGGNDQDNGNGLGEGSGLASTQDKTDDLAHKNILFENFKNLYNSVDKYEAKLASTIGISAEKGEQLNEIRMEFKRIKDLLYDYMIIKFKKKSYTENYLFYKRGVVATNNVLEILDEVWSAEDNNNVEED